jgi:hypothetical protein
MVGRDLYKRPFISFKYKCRQNNYEQLNKKYSVDTNKTYTLTIFQRYSDCNLTWCFSGQGTYGTLFNNSNTLLNTHDKSLVIINILKFLENEKPFYYKYFNMIESYNERRELTLINCYLDK